MNASQIAGVGEFTERSDYGFKSSDSRVILCRPSANDKLTIGEERFSVEEIMRRTEIDPKGAEVFVLKYLSNDGVRLFNSLAIVREGAAAYDQGVLGIIDIRMKNEYDKVNKPLFHADRRTKTVHGDFVLNDHILAFEDRKFVSWSTSSMGCDARRYDSRGVQNFLEIAVVLDPFTSKEQAEAVIEFAHEKYEQ